MAIPSLSSVTNSVSSSVSSISSSIGSNINSMTDGILNNAANITPSKNSNLLDITTGTSITGNAASPAIPATTNVANAPTSTQPSANDTASAATAGASLLVGGGGLAATTFSAGPNDKLATADVYNLGHSPSPINSIQAISKAASSKALDAFKGGAAGLSKLKEIVGTVSSTINSLNNFNLTSFVESMVPGMASILSAGRTGCGPANKLSSGLLNDISGMNSIIGDMNGVGSKLHPSSITCSSELGNIINLMAKANGCGSLQFSIPDINIKAFSLKNILIAALEAGLLGIFGSLICGIADLLLIDKLAASTSDMVAAAGDVASLQSMALNTTPGLLVIANPKLLATIVANINNTVNKNSGSSNVSAIANTLITLNTLNPKWMTTTTKANGVISDLTIATKANSDFNTGIRSLFANATPISAASIKGNIAGCVKKNTIANYDLLFAASLANGITSVSGAISNSFPNTVASINSNTINAGIVIPSNKVISPLMMSA